MVEMVFYSLSSLKAVTTPKKSTFQKLDFEEKRCLPATLASQMK